MPGGSAERIARAFHEVYETAARIHGWSTQEASRTDFDDLPPENKATMISTVQGLLDGGVIASGGHVAKAEKMADHRTEEMLEVSARAQQLHRDLVRAQGRVRMAETRLKNVRGFHDLVLKALEEARVKLGHSRKRAHETGVTDPIVKYWEGRESALREMCNRLDGVLNGAILATTPMKLPTNPLIGKGARVRPKSPAPDRDWRGTVLSDRDSADRVHVRVDEDDVGRVGMQEAMLKVADLTWVGYEDAGVRGRTPDSVVYDEADDVPEYVFDLDRMVMHESPAKGEADPGPPEPQVREHHLVQTGIVREQYKQYKSTPAQIAFFERLGDTVRQIGSRERAEVENRILAGENDIKVQCGRPDQFVRYIVPSPWRHPIRRLRIAIARARHSWRVG